MSWFNRNTPKLTSPVLEGVSASGQIRGMLLTMEVEQRFCNASDQSLEMVYGFPLPYAAQLLETRVQLGERQLHGKVVEKATAQQAYEQAIAEGDTAIVLERNVDHSYTLNLGNLAPGERCIVRFSYAQQLYFNQGNPESWFCLNPPRHESRGGPRPCCALVVPAVGPLPGSDRAQAARRPARARQTGCLGG